MDPLSLLVGFGLGAVALTLVLRRARRTAGSAGPATRTSAPTAEPAAQPSPEPGPEPAVEPDAQPAHERTPEPEPEPEPAPARIGVTEPEPAPRPAPVHAPIVRPAVPAPPPLGHTTLGALAASAPAPGHTASSDADADADADAELQVREAARLRDAVRRAADDGLLVVEGSGLRASAELAALLLATLGDRTVIRVAAPGRHDVPAAATTRDGTSVAATAVSRPLDALGAHDARLPADAVVLVERAELHLHRGLDADALAALRRAHPAVTVVLVVGRAPDGGAIDDGLSWLRGLGGGEPPTVGPDPDERDMLLDDGLARLAQRAPVAIDVVEAAAHATAAGRLPEVPTATVLRLAAGLAGGDPDAPVPPAALAEVLRVVADDGGGDVLLRAGGTGPDGLPTTLAVDPLLVARCVGGVAELSASLLAVLLEDDADDVELLAVARVVAGADDPRPALPVLDRLVGRGGRIGWEARLLRGVIGDRMGRGAALEDYLAVADGSGVDAALAAHARFLAGGLLEAADDVAAARTAYDAVVATGDPVHAPMAAFNLAWIAERTGDVDRASDGYRELAEGTHRDAGPLAALNLAALLERRKRFTEAESWYRVAVDSRHVDAAPMAAVALGLMLERRQRPREARTLFRYAASTGHEEAAPAALRRLGAPRR